jgi:hypothetical protein
MTFEQFQATKATVEGHGELEQSGLSYIDTLLIETVEDSWPDKIKAQGKYCLTIGNSQRISDDLESLERDLYDYAASEGYLD